MEHARHLAKYVFPRQYGLENAFSTPAGPSYGSFRISSYMDREQEIKVRQHIVVCLVGTDTLYAESWFVQDTEAHEASARYARETIMEASQVQIQADSGPGLPVQGIVLLSAVAPFLTCRGSSSFLAEIMLLNWTPVSFL